MYPSGYQIRMAACKGFVIIDPTSTLEQFYIKIRPSMKKFNSDHWELEICERSQPSLFHSFPPFQSFFLSFSFHAIEQSNYHTHVRSRCN
jgi:hypothetical protein